MSGSATPAAPEPADTNSPESKESPFADLMGDNKGNDLLEKLKSKKGAPVVAGVVVLALVAVGIMTMFGGSADQATVEPAPVPTTVAALTASTLTPSYCASPVAVAGAPEPDATGTNVFQSFYLFGTTGWKPLAENGAYTVDYVNQRAESTDLTAVDANQDPAYVSCVTGTANDNDLTCRIYENAARHIVSGADYNLQVFQLSTGEMVIEGPVRNAPATCPLVVVGTVGYSDYLPRQHDLAMWTANLAAPSTFTNVHLDREMMGGSSEWCQSPSSLDTGTIATATGVHLLANEDISMNYGSVNWVTAKMDELSHVACTRFFPSGEDLRCEYKGNNQLLRPEGSFEVTLVDIATGEFTSTGVFEAGNNCPGLVLFNREGQTKNEAALAPAELYEWLNAQNPAPEPEEEVVE